ncbi:MAG: hypothetical protein KR126chlam5_00379 [Candidatus Anoxychlamydiales bacterium]|nr:hypothetical protein [Candidatus Anoxychlamydiales bacterium]
MGKIETEENKQEIARAVLSKYSPIYLFSADDDEKNR